MPGKYYCIAIFFNPRVSVVRAVCSSRLAYSGTSTNGHLPTAAISLQRPSLYSGHIYCKLQSQSIDLLLFPPPNNGRQTLSPGWPLQRGNTVVLKRTCSPRYNQVHQPRVLTSLKTSLYYGKLVKNFFSQKACGSFKASIFANHHASKMDTSSLRIYKIKKFCKTALGISLASEIPTADCLHAIIV